MAEYYPLLAKAIGSLPNSTPDSRRVVYERARKALIGQLRTLHPPVPDEDIERESVALDRAVERLEGELANGVVPAAPPRPPSPPVSNALPSAGSASAPKDSRPSPTLRPPVSKAPASTTPNQRTPSPPVNTPPAPGTSSLKPPSTRPPPLRPPVSKTPAQTPPALSSTAASAPVLLDPPLPVAAEAKPADAPTGPPDVMEAPADAPVFSTSTSSPPPNESRRLKPPQRPSAPQPQSAAGPKRRLWILPVALGVVIALIGAAAWKLRDRPESLVKNKPAEQTENDAGKIAERVGEPSNVPTPGNADTQAEQPTTAPATGNAAQPAQQTPASNQNPEIPVAHRAALLVEAPDEPNKVKTFLGTAVWKLNNAPQGAADAIGLAVEADIDLPDDKTRAIITFEKNTDPSLPASHTIKVRFIVEPGSFSGNVKQISVPQMRPEANPNGELLAGVTVPITTNSFLVGLSPGNAEAANIDLMRRLQWIDIPMLLDSGKIAKLTFEKSESGQRDLNEALEAWQKP